MAAATPRAKRKLPFPILDEEGDEGVGPTSKLKKQRKGSTSASAASAPHTSAAADEEVDV